uniref:SH2 domain-containing protein n=1 Tax=Macrostomum lignano TaxID=282301 RepID=A0A1I8F3U7_9PLAT
ALLDGPIASSLSVESSEELKQKLQLPTLTKAIKRLYRGNETGSKDDSKPCIIIAAPSWPSRSPRAPPESPGSPTPTESTCSCDPRPARADSETSSTSRSRQSRGPRQAEGSEDRENDELISSTVEAGIKCEFLRHGIDIIDSPGLNENSSLDSLTLGRSTRFYTDNHLRHLDSNSGITIAEMENSKWVQTIRGGQDEEFSSFAQDQFRNLISLEQEDLPAVDEPSWRKNRDELLIQAGLFFAERKPLILDEVRALKYSESVISADMSQKTLRRSGVDEIHALINEQNNCVILRLSSGWGALKTCSVSKENLVDVPHHFTKWVVRKPSTREFVEKITSSRKQLVEKSHEADARKSDPDIKALYPESRSTSPAFTMDVTSSTKFRIHNLVHVVGVRLHKRRPKENWYTV